MNLPQGVFDRPRQPLLIEKDDWAIVRIETGRFPLNLAYQIKSRSYREAVVPCLRGDWEEFDRLFGLGPHTSDEPNANEDGHATVFSVAEHRPDAKDLQRLPDITVVPNLTIKNTHSLISPWIVFGSSLGHYHPLTEFGYHVQEVYEFQSYGAMVLDHGDGRVELWIAQAGDKIAVPTSCHMTLYNLNYHPLITLHLAQSNHDPDESIVRKYGPILLAYFNDSEVVFSLNSPYINNLTAGIGVRLKEVPRLTRERQVRISRGARLELGRLLYEQLTMNPDLIGEFARLGVRVRAASPEAVLEPLDIGNPSKLYFSQTLVKAATKGTDVYRYFFPDSERIDPPPFSIDPHRSAKKSADDRNESIDLEVDQTSSHRHLVVVVEGSGVWVEETYRRLFKTKVDEYRKSEKDISLSVIYADDSRWKTRPGWSVPDDSTTQKVWDPTCSGLQDWEIYLDKADPEGIAQYLNLRPDVVFVVTPDFTHCALAQQWIGKTPLVLIEKPFDSQITNVENLLLKLGQQQKAIGATQILGLDHYQFYARPVDALKGLIDLHLGPIARVNFYLTENRPIELSRVRTLQYGLTLDLLPHFIALLTYFGDIGSIDEINVVEAGQYYPLEAASRDGLVRESITEFEGETYSDVRFTFHDHSGNDFPIPCRAIVGKGFAQEVKYLEVTGSNHNAIRVDLNRAPDGDESNYPWDSLMFLQGDGENRVVKSEVMTVTDPYSAKPMRILFDPQDPMHLRPKLERERYHLLLRDLLEEGNEAVRNTLTQAQGREIVSALDRIWWAIRESKPWIKYSLGALNPLC